MRSERVLLTATPFAAMVAVALGLGLGSHGAVRAAVVVGAPRSAAGTGLAWQVVAFDEDHGARTPLARAPIELIARSAQGTARWDGTTNDDGIAEARLDVVSDAFHLQVRSGPMTLAEGEVAVADGDVRRSRADDGSSGGPWMPFARRTGAIALDVALLGGRAAPGFPSVVCVHATEATSGAPVSGAAIDIVDDPSLTATRGGVTDSEGWAILHATPVGLAIALEVRARRGDGTATAEGGDWVGGLYASPGGAQIVTRPRWGPDEAIAIDIVTPTSRRTEYVEVDDAMGRVWADTLDSAGSPGEMARASEVVPKLPPGLYWAVVASDPGGAEGLGPGTTARPFFVAASDTAALDTQRGVEGCLQRRDAREEPQALWPCLALARPSPAPRRVVLDGATARRALQGGARARGLAVALGALVIASVLEGAIVLRSGSRARSRLGAVFVGVMVALLGFALLALFLARVA